MLNINSAKYVQTCVTTLVVASIVGGDEANSEKMIQDNIIIVPSKQTAAYPLKKLLPIFEVGSPANVERGIGAIAV